MLGLFLQQERTVRAINQFRLLMTADYRKTKWLTPTLTLMPVAVQQKFLHIFNSNIGSD